MGDICATGREDNEIPRPVNLQPSWKIPFSRGDDLARKRIITRVLHSVLPPSLYISFSNGRNVNCCLHDFPAEKSESDVKFVNYRERKANEFNRSLLKMEWREREGREGRGGVVTKSEVILNGQRLFG